MTLSKADKYHLGSSNSVLSYVTCFCFVDFFLGGLVGGGGGGKGRGLHLENKLRRSSAFCCVIGRVSTKWEGIEKERRDNDAVAGRPHLSSCVCTFKITSKFLVMRTLTLKVTYQQE